MTRASITVKVRLPRLRMLAARGCVYALILLVRCRAVSQDAAEAAADSLAAFVAAGTSVHVQ